MKEELKKGAAIAVSLGGAALALRKCGEEAEGVSQRGCVDSGNEFLRQKKGPWRERKQRHPP